MLTARFLVLLTFVLFSTITHADSSSGQRAESAENTVFEGQNGVKPSDPSKYFDLFADGVFQTGYSAVLTSDKRNIQSTTISIESRILCENSTGRCNQSDFENRTRDKMVTVLPFEITARFKMNEDQAAEIQRARAGIIRLISNISGITAQAFSYYLNQNEVGLGRYQGFEVASITVNRVVNLTKNDTAQFVFKGFLAINIVGRFDSTDKVVSSAGGVLKTVGEISSSSTNLFGIDLNGSVGIRFKKRALLDFFAGMNTTGVAVTTQEGSNLTNAFYGGGFRVVVTQWLHIRGLVQKDHYYVDTFSSFNDPFEKLRTSALATKGMFEMRW